MRTLARFAVLALIAVVAAGCMGDDDDSSARRAAIGSSTPVAGQGSLASPSLINGAAFKVVSWEWGVSVPVTIGSSTGGISSGAPNASPFTITKNVDNASTALHSAAVRGLNLPTLTFKVGTSLTYVFTNARVTSVKQSGSESDGNEEVSFAYAKVQMTNAAAGPTTVTCFDFGLRASC